jgi:hypothetical protein
VTALNCPALTTSYVDESEEVVSSYSSFQWRWYNDGSTDAERLKVDDVTIKGYVSETFYAFDVVFRFDSVTLGLEDYSLYVDFYTPLTGSDELVFKIDDIDNPVHQVGLVQDSFNVDVTSLITASTMYLSIDDVVYRIGDSVQTTAYIERIYLSTGEAEWAQFDDAKVYFDVPFDMWGYNTGLILLGLIMIPTSSLYLAYGVKHDRSSNRLYYGIIIFLVGCGLFIGGILPP